MLISKEIQETRNRLLDFEKRIDDMHLDFQKYSQGIEVKMPDYERLERELLLFSRRKIFDLQISNQLDRILYKFQNRKKIWLKWADEFQRGRPEKARGEPKAP